MSEEKLSVIVLSKNNRDTIVTCINSVLRALPENKEVIVVDASNDGSELFLQSLGGRILYVRDSGLGIGLARNLEIQKSTGDIICFVDADTIIEPYHFVKIKRIFDEKPEVGVVSANPRYYFKGINMVQELEYYVREQRRIRGEEHAVGYSHFALECFFSLRREVWEEFKFWHVKYGADDLDFSMKAVSKGWKIYCIDTESIHIPRATLPALFKEQYGWGQGKKEFHKIHPEYSSSYGGKIKNPFILTTISYLLSPIISLKYAIPSRKAELIPYYVFRQFSFLLGYIFGCAKIEAIL